MPDFCYRLQRDRVGFFFLRHDARGVRARVKRARVWHAEGGGWRVPCTIKAIQVPSTMRATAARVSTRAVVSRAAKRCPQPPSNQHSRHEPQSSLATQLPETAQRQRPPSLARMRTQALQRFHAHARALVRAPVLGKNTETHRDEAPPLCRCLHLRTRWVRAKMSSRRRPGFARPCTCAACVGGALDCLRQLHCTAACFSKRPQRAALPASPFAHAFGGCHRPKGRGARHRTRYADPRTSCTDSTHTPRTHSSSP